MEPGGTVGLTEGFFDALSITQATGTPAFATTGTDLSDEAAAKLATYGRVVFIPDTDDPGKLLHPKVIGKLADKTDLRMAHLPEGVKDANELLCVRGEDALAEVWNDGRSPSLQERFGDLADVCDLTGDVAEDEDEPQVVNNFARERDVIAICAEEGGGKTTMD